MEGIRPQKKWRATHFGEIYMMIKAEPSLMCGGDVAVIRTCNTLVFGLFKNPVILRQCIERIIKMADYMEVWREFDLRGNEELHIVGEIYMTIKAEPSLMCGGGVAVIRTGSTLVFGLFKDPVIPRQCIERIRKMADYME
ncbi:profilin-like [Primulina eburnea]|uniref:profilin-like n=1 Tax=Primulina eburnea TaxID=1245227 RepID=UPI003C6BFA58